MSVVDFDFGARFVSDGTPFVLPGERRMPVRMSIQNNGPQIWKKDQVRIGYHWYYQDGSEVQWEDETTPIAQDVPPGKTVRTCWSGSRPRPSMARMAWCGM